MAEPKGQTYAEIQLDHISQMVSRIEKQMEVCQTRCNKEMGELFTRLRGVEEHTWCQVGKEQGKVKFNPAWIYGPAMALVALISLVNFVMGWKGVGH